MKCPVCDKEMARKDFGGTVVDVCENGCKSIWFDWMELSKLDEKDEGVGQALQAAMKYPRVNDANRKPIKCPKCGIPMRQHKYQSAKEVNVDECYNCGGFFLDSGELAVIRENFMTEKEREAYEEKLLAAMPEYKEAKEDLEARHSRADAMMKYSRFLRLSYYMTGK